MLLLSSTNRRPSSLLAMWQQAVLVISAFASKLSRKITKFSSLTKLLSVQRIINHGAYKIDLLLGCIGVVAWNDQEYY